MTDFAELEQAEAFTFSIRATQIKQGAVQTSPLFQ